MKDTEMLVQLMENTQSQMPLLNKNETHECLLRPVPVTFKEKLRVMASEEVIGKNCNSQSTGQNTCHHCGNITVTVEIFLLFQRVLRAARKHL